MVLGDPHLEDPFYFGGDSMAGFTIKLEFFYHAWKAMQDWITGSSANKPKVEVDGTVQVSNLPEVQQVAASEPLPVSLYGTFVRHSTEPKPSGSEGDTLLLYDTKQVFIHDGTDWREW